MGRGGLGCYYDGQDAAHQRRVTDVTPIYDNILAKFTPVQNTALFDIFANGFWTRDEGFLLAEGGATLFAHGKPTIDLIDQLVLRQLDAPPACVVPPIQKHWSAIAKMRILDLALVALNPWRPGPPIAARPALAGSILEIAGTSPAAYKYLFFAVVEICCTNLVARPAYKLLDIMIALGVYVGDNADVFAWLFVELPEDDQLAAARMQNHLRDEGAGRWEEYGIIADDDSFEKLRAPSLRAMKRLGIQAPWQTGNSSAPVNQWIDAVKL
ncbi:hypothetical protein B0H13DRAFT_1872215 [Mycena leptocephala]|nr:hypothetical protein B0H13DRAFT_1872215 [Mycena leptocephala]